MRRQKVSFFEAKSKSAATWYRKKQRWQTGIDKRHWKDYKRVQEVTEWPVWLLFLQRCETSTNATEDAPDCPTGLFGCPIMQPIADDGYYFRGDRRYDMVYWAISDLKLIATLAEVIAA